VQKLKSCAHLFDHLEGIDLGKLANAFQRITDSV
jgi:hypothetical protein